MRATKALISVFATAALIVGLEVKWSADIPAIAVFLNPATGFWQNSDSKHVIKERELNLDGLQGKVIIKYDDHMIPHIFADNEYDLYYAQGYVTATDRLWQMDIQTRSASGRLAEVVGPKALGIDRHHRRMGMVYGAEKSIDEMMKDPKLKVMIQAYTDGINAYIHSLWPRDYPLEFKLLDYEPEDWKPIDCAFLLKQMTETLAGGTNSPEMTNVLKKFGPEVTKDLFPDYPFREDPIIPADTKWDFQALPLPKASAELLTNLVSPVDHQEKVEGLGSNNWAIAGSKTKSGYPILANDPHLNLTLPSIWFQVQLHAPGINVNGVSIPGAPGVIIGYNDKVSWGVTNVDADVLDYYQIKFKDSSRNEYWYNNKWNKTTKRIERIDVHNGATLYDTVVYTHHGPVVYNILAQRPDIKKNVPVACAMRWIGHERSKDLLAFYLLNRAQNYDDYRTALSQYSGPAQNFIFASADKDIAITVNGKFPLKYQDQGKFILDGTNPNDDWHGWIPFEQNPTAKNPTRGFLSSANQSSTDPKYPYYLNWSFVPYERGKRINERLSVMTNATVDSMRSIQNDNYSIMAQDALPMMLDLLSTAKLSKQQSNAVHTLKVWDRYYNPNSQGATIFDNWWHKFYDLIWDDEFGGDGLNKPSRDRTVKLLLGEHTSKWIDNINTPEKETLHQLIANSFKATVDELYKDHGKPGEGWEWGRVKSTYINHLANVPGMGVGNIIAGGYGSSVNALIDGHGPSWRMVVQTGPTVQGYGILPGGESGNPGSVYFNDMLPTWRAGELQPLLFLHSPAEASKRIVSTLTLNSK